MRELDKKFFTEHYEEINNIIVKESGVTRASISFGKVQTVLFLDPLPGVAPEKFCINVKSQLCRLFNNHKLIYNFHVSLCTLQKEDVVIPGSISFMDLKPSTPKAVVEKRSFAEEPIELKGEVIESAKEKGAPVAGEKVANPPEKEDPSGKVGKKTGQLTSSSRHLLRPPPPKEVADSFLKGLSPDPKQDLSLAAQDCDEIESALSVRSPSHEM